MKEIGGGDYFEIGFRGPGVDEHIIGGNRIEAPPAASAVPLPLSCGGSACAFYYHDKNAYRSASDKSNLGSPQLTERINQLSTR